MNVTDNSVVREILEGNNKGALNSGVTAESKKTENFGEAAAAEKNEEKKEEQKKENAAAIATISEEAKRLFYEQLENSNKENPYVDMIKLIEIASRIAKGDKVPPSDEKKLLEAEPDMYLSAKMAAALNENKKHKKHKALFDDEDKNSMDEKIRELEAESGVSSDEASDSESVEVESESGEESGESVDV